MFTTSCPSAETQIYKNKKKSVFLTFQQFFEIVFPLIFFRILMKRLLKQTSLPVTSLKWTSSSTTSDLWNAPSLIRCNAYSATHWENSATSSSSVTDLHLIGCFLPGPVTLLQLGRKATNLLCSFHTDHRSATSVQTDRQTDVCVWLCGWYFFDWLD